MRQIPDTCLWIGHRGDANDIPSLHKQEIQAVVDLADNEPCLILPREFIYLRFPLMDGKGNPAWLVQMICSTVKELVQHNISVLVCCSAGMSRSPFVAAHVLASSHGISLGEALEQIRKTGPLDIQNGLFNQ